MYENPKKFFVRMLLLTILTIISVILLVFLSSAGVPGLIVALILTLINAVALLIMLGISSTSIFKYLRDKERKNLGFHIFNFLFSLFVAGVFGLFYLTIVAGAMIILLPFL